MPRKTNAQLDREIDAAITATPPNIIDVLKRAPYQARVTFSDRSKRFGPGMYGDQPRWIAFIQGVLGHDASGEGLTRETAVRAAVQNLPPHIRRHFESSRDPMDGNDGDEPDRTAQAALERIRQGCRASTGQDNLYLHRNRLYRWRQTTEGARGVGGVVEEQTGAGSPTPGMTADELKRRAEAGWTARDNFIFLGDGTLRGPNWMKALAGQR